MVLQVVEERRDRRVRIAEERRMKDRVQRDEGDRGCGGLGEVEDMFEFF